MISETHENPLAVLLVEDSALDAKVIEGQLSHAPETAFTLAVSDTLARGLELLDAQRFDVVLLDLNLPDSAGLKTFLKVFRIAPQVPVVIITAQDDRELATNAVCAGAQDFLVKGRTDVEGLVQAIRFAIKRHERLRRLSPHLSGLRSRTPAAEPADLLPDSEKLYPPLREREAQTFETLAARYAAVLDAARTQRASKQVLNVSDELSDLAMYLFTAFAGASDAEEIHRDGLERHCQDVPSETQPQVFLESQLLLIELLGYLTDLYRDNELQRAPRPAID